MNNIPEFSIVTVCFNSEKTITRTIESVLNQKFKNYEYIIVDGASKDNTINIVKSYETKFEGRLRYISEPDKGIYDAFNKGVRMSTGKYVWIVNSDDYIEPNALEELATITTKYSKEDAPVISAAMNFITEIQSKVIKSSAKRVDYAYKTDTMGVTHPATLVPKMVYEVVGFYDDQYKIIGDIDWFHRAYGLKTPILFIDNVITNMVCGGISTQYNFKRSYRDRKHYLKKHHKNIFTRYISLIRWVIRFYIKKRKTTA